MASRVARRAVIGNTPQIMEASAITRSLRRASVVVLCSLAAPAGAGDAVSRGAEIKQVVYMYSVAEYCGLNTKEVYDGYRLQMRQLTRDGRLPESTVRWLRIHGMLSADLEYDDRGLGGFRNWCRTEGQDAAVHFKSYGAAHSADGRADSTGPE